MAIAFLIPLAAPLLSPGDAGERTNAATSIDWHCLLVSLLTCAAAATMATALGSAIAAMLYAPDFPCRRTWGVALMLPLASPPMSWTMGLVACYGAGGLLERRFGDAARPWLSAIDRGHFAACAAVLAQLFAPLAMLVVSRGMARLGGAGLEAAWLALPRWRLTRFALAALRGELLSSWLLCFVLSLGAFATPHVLQCQTYAINIYQRANGSLDHGGAMQLAWPLVAICLGGSLAFLWHMPPAAAGDGTSGCFPRLGPWRWPAAAGLAAYILTTTVLPICAGVVECGSWNGFAETVRKAAPETENTLLIASLTGCLATAAGFVCSVAAPGRGDWARSAIALLPLSLPAILVGLAYASFFNSEAYVDWHWLRSGSGLVSLGFTARVFPWAAWLIAAERGRWRRSWDEAARLGDLSAWRRWRYLVAPRFKDVALATVAAGAALSMADVEIAQLLCAPGAGTLSLRLFTYLHFQPPVAASLALLQWLLALVPLATYALLADRCWPATRGRS